MVVMLLKACTYADVTGLWARYWKLSALPWDPWSSCANIALWSPAGSFFCAILLLVFCNISANSLDTVVVNESSGELLILEVDCTFSHNLEKAFFTFRLLTYQQLQHTVS